MRILLISGHGAGDVGAVGNNCKEANETRNMTKLIAEYLKGTADVSIYPTARNAYYDYRKGLLGSTANFGWYDYVLEIHFNAISASYADGRTKGSEVWVTPTEKSYGVEKEVLNSLKNLGFTNRGVKVSGNLAVINAAKRAGVSSALLEVCFIDDTDDMLLYLKDRNRVAQAIAGGIIKGFNLVPSVGSDDKEEKDEMVTYATYKEIPAWAKPTVKKLMDKGLLEGTGSNKLNLEHNMLRVLVINDRAGLYD